MFAGSVARRHIGRNALVCLFLPFQRPQARQIQIPGRGLSVIDLGRAMHDPVDIRRRIDRLVARVDRRDDYGQLLASGQVMQRFEDVEDVEAWRAEIRRQARADKIKVRTGIDDGAVWALRVRSRPPDALPAGIRYRDLLRRTTRLAVELRHEPTFGVRDGDELVCYCARCSALGYGDAATDVVGGPLLEEECPNDAPPKLTAMTLMHVPGSLRPQVVMSAC